MDVIQVGTLEFGMGAQQLLSDPRLLESTRDVEEARSGCASEGKGGRARGESSCPQCKECTTRAGMNPVFLAVIKKWEPSEIVPIVMFTDFHAKETFDILLVLH